VGLSRGDSTLSLSPSSGSWQFYLFVSFLFPTPSRLLLVYVENELFFGLLASMKFNSQIFGRCGFFCGAPFFVDNIGIYLKRNKKKKKKKKRKEKKKRKSRQATLYLFLPCACFFLIFMLFFVVTEFHFLLGMKGKKK
jgi:amino acid permease